MLPFFRSRLPKRSNDDGAPLVVVDGRPLTSMQTIVLYVAASSLRERLNDPAYFRDRSRLGPVYRAEAQALCELLKPHAPPAPRLPLESPT